MFVLQLLRQIRLAHWLKNLMLLLPAYFGGRLLSMAGASYGTLALVFLCISSFSSAVYCINDIVDLQFDRLHPAKRRRPLAAGYFSVLQVVTMAIICLCAGGIFLAFIPSEASIGAASYLLLSLLYCFWLKKMPVIDLAVIALGFVLRLYIGSAATGVPLSHWIIIVTFLLMFSVALAKRRDDLVLSSGQDVVFRTAQGGYNKQFIDTAKAVSFAVTLVAYILYSVSPEVMQRLHSSCVYITALPVFIGIMRYLQLSIVEENTGSPLALLFRDPILLLAVAVWLGSFYCLIYG